MNKNDTAPKWNEMNLIWSGSGHYAGENGLAIPPNRRGGGPENPNTNPNPGFGFLRQNNELNQTLEPAAPFQTTPSQQVERGWSGTGRR